MKRLLVCLLLVGAVGCGESEQEAQQPNGESQQESSPGGAQSNANLTACPDCEKEVSKRATACPHCGAPLTQQASQPEPARPDVPRPGSQPAGQSGNAQPPTVGKTTVNSIGMKLTLIPAGEFRMGSPASEADRRDDETRYQVKITKPFYLSVYEVTQEQFEQVMKVPNPSRLKGPQNPVEKVSWNDAVEFCRKLSALPAEKSAGYVYRLPTEAEWEYACRAGTQTAYSFGDSESELGDYAWYKENSGGTTHPVGGKKPNAWGLYDMHGNVWEWCEDWHDIYPSGSVTDPTGASSGSFRVDRGGSWNISSDYCRSATRIGDAPDSRYDSLGFRVLRSSIK